MVLFATRTKHYLKEKTKREVARTNTENNLGKIGFNSLSGIRCQGRKCVTPTGWTTREEHQSKENEFGLTLTAQEPPLLCQGPLLSRNKPEAQPQQENPAFKTNIDPSLG